MKIDFGAKLLDMKQKPIPQQQEDGTTADMTLGSASAFALLNLTAHDQNSHGGGVKARRFKLAMKVSQEKVLDLDPKDVAMIQERLDLMFGPLIVGRAEELLNPKD